MKNRHREMSDGSGMEQEKPHREHGDGGNGMPDPIVYKDAIDGFMSDYAWEPHPEDATDYMTIGDLRLHLAAFVPFSTPDAMPAIIGYLGSHGYFLRHVGGFSEPVMCLRRTSGEEEAADSYTDI